MSALELALQLAAEGARLVSAAIEAAHQRDEAAALAQLNHALSSAQIAVGGLHESLAQVRAEVDEAVDAKFGSG